MSQKEKSTFVAKILIKFLMLMGLLYLFICSLGLLSDAFRLLGGKTAGNNGTNI